MTIARKRRNRVGIKKNFKEIKNTASALTDVVGVVTDRVFGASVFGAVVSI